MTEILFNPKEFFLRLKDRPPALGGPVLLVLLASFLAGLVEVLATRLLPSPFPMGGGLARALGLLGAALGGVAVWGILGLILRLLAGPRARAWEVLGWTSAPGVVLGLVLLPVAALWPISGNLPEPPSPDQVQAFQDWLKAYEGLRQASLYQRLFQALNVLTTFWSLALIYLGLRTLVPERALLGTLGMGVLYLLTLLPSLFR